MRHRAARPRPRRPTLTDRLAARATALAMDATISTAQAGKELAELGHQSAAALTRALARINARPRERPNHFATAAGHALHAGIVSILRHAGGSKGQSPSPPLLPESTFATPSASGEVRPTR